MMLRQGRCGDSVVRHSDSLLPFSGLGKESCSWGGAMWVTCVVKEVVVAAVMELWAGESVHVVLQGRSDRSGGHSRQ